METPSKFTGTSNPRHLRAIQALLQRPQRREHIDAVAGCSNGPQLISDLRHCGLELPCERVPDIDRDGRTIKRGVYYFTKSDPRKVHAWFRQRNKARGKA